MDLGVAFGFGIGMMELGVDFGFGIGMDRRRSEIMVAVWIWVDDRVMEKEDHGGGGKGLFLQLGFWVEVTDPVKTVMNLEDKEEEGFCLLMGFGVMVVAEWW